MKTKRTDKLNQDMAALIKCEICQSMTGEGNECRVCGNYLPQAEGWLRSTSARIGLRGSCVGHGEGTWDYIDAEFS
jgi:hypothetical protein